MRPLRVRLAVLLTALVLLGTSRARADMVDFAYEWTVMPSTVVPNGNGTGTISLLASTGTDSANLGGSPTVVDGATVFTSSSATDPPDTFGTDFNMKLKLTDSLSGDSTLMTFSGTISGTLTQTDSTLTSTFHGAVSQQATLGGHVYTVTIDPALVSFPAPGSQTPALID